MPIEECEGLTCTGLIDVYMHVYYNYGACKLIMFIPSAYGAED